MTSSSVKYVCVIYGMNALSVMGNMLWKVLLVVLSSGRMLFGTEKKLLCVGVVMFFSAQLFMSS